MGPRAGLDGCGKYHPSPGFDPRTVQPVASRCTVHSRKLCHNIPGTSVYPIDIPVPSDFLPDMSFIATACMRFETAPPVVMLTLLFSGMWRHVFRYTRADISEKTLNSLTVHSENEILKIYL